MNLLPDQIAVFSIAVLLDLLVGDPPERTRFERFYPIVWISRLAYFFDRITQRGNPRREKVLGAVSAVATISVFALPCLTLSLLPDLFYIVLGSLVFKMTFTIKGLERFGRAVAEAGKETGQEVGQVAGQEVGQVAGQEVGQEVGRGEGANLEAKRAAVAKIVSREVAGLNEAQLNSAAIESVAENTTDSVVAPFFYFTFFGLLGFGVFGAMFYRVVNTLDAVVGYRNERYEHFGWFSARLDDLMNFVPERVAAGLILLAGGSRAGAGLRGETGEVHLTIVAMSRALRVRLEKVGHYCVGGSREGFEFEDARTEHIEEAIKIMQRSAVAFALVCVAFFYTLILFASAV